MIQGLSLLCEPTVKTSPPAERELAKKSSGGLGKIQFISHFWILHQNPNKTDWSRGGGEVGENVARGCEDVVASL